MKTTEEQLAESLAAYKADNPFEYIDVEDYAAGFGAAYALGFEARLQPTPIDTKTIEDDYSALMDLVHLTSAEVYAGLPMLDHNTRFAIALGKGVEAAIAAGFKRRETAGASA
jgi:hypothetical protein